MSFKPLLAPGECPSSYTDYFKNLQYPLLCSPKYDGIRCIIKDGHCMSRSGKVLPSIQAQALFSHLEGLDGELIEGDPTDFDVYNRTQSHVMSAHREGDLRFFVFDNTSASVLELPFIERFRSIEICSKKNPNVELIEQIRAQDYDELMNYETTCLRMGFEGIMMRNPDGRYKCGRATYKEGVIYKLKRFSDAEGVIIGIDERMTNTNALETDELGYAKRSSAKEGLVGANTVGRFIVECDGAILEIGTGNFKHDELKAIWDSKEVYIGKILKFRYFAHGVKDKPRFPRAIGLRDKIDL